jgi:ornithine cyclodeaminase/alanine dehydrogenase-like protein (mu-crystallin family)
MALYLTETEIKKIINMELALNSVEEAFQLIALGDAVTKPRERLPVGSSSLNYMSAGIDKQNLTGLKVYVPSKNGTKFYFHIMNSLNGEMIAIMEANALGQFRTGAASGVASKYLAKKDSKKVLLIGTGYQAYTQALALDRVFELDEIYVYSRAEENRMNFINNYSSAMKSKLTPVADIESNVNNIDIISVITNSKTPVINSEIIESGVHINAAGSNHSLRRELDTKTILKADKIFVDDIDQAKMECGDLIYPESLGLIQWRNIINFSDVLKFPDRFKRNFKDITIFESQGLALWDLVTAINVCEIAKTKGIGEKINA